MLMHAPPHPGILLREMWLKPLNMSVTQAATLLKVSRKTLSEIMNARSTVTPEMAVRFELVFGKSAESWLAHQAAHDLWAIQPRRSDFGVHRITQTPPPTSLEKQMDALLTAADSALRTVFAHHHAKRPTPMWAAEVPTPAPLNDAEKREASALMRVNHVGEVCAQALYTAQALATRDDALRQHLTTACNEETDHLAWCEQRLHALGGRTSLLNPLWYAGAFGIGYAAAKLGGDRMSLGFVVETERQVEAHLESHLGLLPTNDGPSRAIVAQMKTDEAQHAKDALAAGATELPTPFKALMRVAAKVMTTVAHRV